jgi:hypothetical protein
MSLRLRHDLARQLALQPDTQLFRDSNAGRSQSAVFQPPPSRFPGGDLRTQSERMTGRGLGTGAGRALLRGDELSDSMHWYRHSSMSPPPLSQVPGTSAASLPTGEVRIDISQPSVGELLAIELDRIPWSALACEGQPYHEHQQQLERGYKAWATGVLEVRQEAFGEVAYGLLEDMQTPVRDAVLPALYQGVRQFISSAARSPLRNAIVTQIGPRNNAQGQNVGELNNSLDPAVIGGLSGGGAAYAVDAWGLQAMDRRARLSNFPVIKAVDVHVLVPNPGPIRLRLTDGAKEYWCPVSEHAGGHIGGSADVRDPSLPRDGDPTAVALKNEAIAVRESLLRWQGNLDGKGILTWFQPAVSGAFNTLRRRISTAKSLLQPLPVFGNSILASSSAGAMAKFAIDMSKVMPGLAQTNVDNLVGGTQRVNLFSVKAPNPELRAANFGDIKRLPQFTLDMLSEGGSLLRHFFDPRRSWREMGGQVQDVVRVMVAGSTASVVSAATGQKLAEILRDGSPAARLGESFKSGANLLQQFGQSTMNDYMWNATKDFTKNDAYDLGVSLDRKRDHTQQTLLIRAGEERRKLPILIDQWRSLMPSQPFTDELSESMRDNRDINVEHLQALREVLGNYGGIDTDVQQQAHANLLNGLDTVINLIAERDALVTWRSPVGMAGDSTERSR